MDGFQRKIGILTAGGDCPGLNAVIRAVVRSLHLKSIAVLGIQDGYRGLVEGAALELGYDDVRDLLTRGGSILGSSNKDNPFQYLDMNGKKPVFRNRAIDALRHARDWELEGLIILGGDGSMKVAGMMSKLGLPCIGVPKTIDNDVFGTELSFGFDTAVHIATEAMDRLHTTASTHHRVMVVEVMGRTAGWLALASGLAAGADAILIPEIPSSLKAVLELIATRRRHGRFSSIIAVAEGSKPFGKAVVARREKYSVEQARLGGVGARLADEIQIRLGVEARAVTLGHVVRGGTPTAFDRNLATSYGVEAARLAMAGRWGRMVTYQKGAFGSMPLKSAAGKTRLIPKKHPWIRAALDIGVSFGN
jgi:6-phosphofructokinase 1